MKVFLFDQKNNFYKNLEILIKHSIVPYSKQTLKHKISTKVIKLNSNLDMVDLKSFFNYNIFPPNILQAYTQWEHEKRTMQVNDTILQQIQIPPFRAFSQKIIVGVRIKEIFNHDNCKGFSYETLQGHVEKGISTFKIEQINNSLTFTIETYSAANGSFLSFFQPLSVFYQNYCTQKALDFVAKHYFLALSQ